MMGNTNNKKSVAQGDIAIVGMAAHFPGAPTIDVFWENLRDGVESIIELSEEQLIANGETSRHLNNSNYVPHAAVLDAFEEFDADFFGFSPKEAAILDPQHRQLLEVAWEALENAGHPPAKFDGPVGVFAGCGMGTYFYSNICSNVDLVDEVGMFLLRHTGNDKDFLSTRLSHVFDLTGPSINVQTACSTSLVAAHYACKALRDNECDMALAGGVTIELPHGRGYVFKEGEILSPDGHCHAFDHRAEGTVFGSGAGVVVLRRLQDAIDDGDHIWGVIRGSAINNDGANKASYLAPSVDGQAAAIAAAHKNANITADTVDFVECHGTGTYLGDPIEVAALTEAFSETTDKTGFCSIGSVKTNIGHLDTAAGVASLIKATLSLHNRQIPPSLGFEEPNPAIDFDDSPFKVNDTLVDWVSTNGPRRAGVNSLGVGGTNAHLLLEEAPVRAPSEESEWPFQILTVSGRSPAALDANSQALAKHLRANPDQPLADIAWTLQNGRQGFEKRRVLVAENNAQAADLLEENDTRRVFSHSVMTDDPEFVFMFPGGGAQYAGMARDLYETEPVFQDWMDRGLDILQPKLDYDIRALWLPEDAQKEAADERLRTPSVQLPLIMIVEYALAQLWMSWGVKPTALVGHSMGENTAACIAGVISFEDCIGLVHLRGELFDSVAPGGMLSVGLPAEELKPFLTEGLDLGAENAPRLSVATGPKDELEKLENTLASQDIDSQIIPINIAAHSRMLEPILKQFGDFLRSIELSPPKIPFVSNRNGDYITPEQATDPEYWVGHLRNTVYFANCISTLSQTPDRVFIEIGPGNALASLTGQHDNVSPNQVISSLRHARDDVSDDAYFLAMLGRVWAVGGKFDWAQIWGDARRNRVVLPSYQFQRASYFIEPATAAAGTKQDWLTRTEPLEDWGYRPVWIPRYSDCEVDTTGDLSDAPNKSWLIFIDENGIGNDIAKRLREAGHQVVTVLAGDVFRRAGDDSYVIAPERGRESYDALLRELIAGDQVPTDVVHCWLATNSETFRPGSSFFHRNQEQGFFSLLFFAQAVGDENLPVDITVLTSGVAKVLDEKLRYPDRATVMGPVKVIPREFPNMSCSLIDIEPAVGGGLFGKSAKDEPRKRLVNQVLEDLLTPPSNSIIALRGEKRFLKTYGKQKLPAVSHNSIHVRDGGAYLITGGFGGLGLSIAKELIEKYSAGIVLLSRSVMPPREQWDSILENLSPKDPVSRRILAVQNLESIGGNVLCLKADVSNLEDMNRAIGLANEQFGKIDGVIHAAGVIDDTPIMAKTLTSIEDVFTPKIHGTQVLDTVFPDGSIDWMVLFSSTSTATAPAGQVDYVAANEYLNAYANTRAGDATRVLALNWGIWSDVGMASDIIGSWSKEQTPAPVKPAQVPMLDEATFDDIGNRLFTARYQAKERWFLDEHRTREGNALLPGTGYLELAAEALHSQGEDGVFEIRDLYMLHPLSVSDDGPQDISLHLPRSDEGYEFRVESGSGQSNDVNAQASLSLLPLLTPGRLNLDEILARCGTPVFAPDGERLTSQQEKHLNFGPRWSVLMATALGHDEGLAHLKLLDSVSNDLQSGYILHPGLMDLATGWAMELIADYDNTKLWVPVSYKSVQVFKRLPSEIVSWVRNSADNRADAQTATFDVTITSPDGTVCVEIKGFSIRRIGEDTGFANIQAGATGTASPAIAFPVQLSLAQERLRHNHSQGIKAAEGTEAFFRALALGLPNILITSLDLPSLIEQADTTVDDSNATNQKFQRPTLDTDFTPPENDLEERLAGFWQDLLGVEQVGVEDNFFDLGGHSLIAVRLFSLVRKAYNVDFPISVLFEAPTIRKCANLIVAQGIPANADGDAEKPDTPSPTLARRFTHLVPMHTGEGGPKTPFFLVAGMFGNVLNLRHLAHLLGTDRPFYGLQARGLYGDVEPHNSLVNTATDYIAEMRMVQPKGPYAIGGFSGGGITAYEIAQQLIDAGEEVAALVMLDTPLPFSKQLSFADRMKIQMLELRSKKLGYPIQWVTGRIKWEIKKWSRRHQDGPEVGQLFHNAAIESAFLHSLKSYELKTWAGNLTLFRPPLVGKWKVAPDRWVNHERDYVLADNGWTDWAPNVEIFEVPGDHDSMVLEPNVRVLASRMKKCLEAADRHMPLRLRWDDKKEFKGAAE